MLVPVEEGQNLIMAVAVQTVGRAMWNIQATMVECKHVGQVWTGRMIITPGTWNRYQWNMLQMRRAVGLCLHSTIPQQLLGRI